MEEELLIGVAVKAVPEAPVIVMVIVAGMTYSNFAYLNIPRE